MDFDLRGQQGMHLSSGGSLIMDYGLFWTDSTVSSSNPLIMDLFLTNMQLFALQDINWCTGVMWTTYRVFQLQTLIQVWNTLFVVWWISDQIFFFPHQIALLLGNTVCHIMKANGLQTGFVQIPVPKVWICPLTDKIASKLCRCCGLTFQGHDSSIQ